MVKAPIVALYGGAPQTADDFFRSVQGAFQKNEDSAGTVGYALLGLAALGALLAFLWPLVRKRNDERLERATFARLVAARRLDSAQVELLSTLAEHAGTHPLLVATHIDVFERATAAELRGLQPATVIRDGSIHQRLRALRDGLGFASHTEHEPLLTTRELLPGYSVEMLGEKTTIAGVTEACFSLVLPERPASTIGTKVALTVLHEHEASYSVASPLVAVEPAASGFTLFFAHDEAPARQQHRQFVRVPATGPIDLTLTPEPGARANPSSLAGALLDLSLHGAAISLREKLAVRTRLRVSFSFRDETFVNVEVVVLECDGPPDGPYRLRLHFRDLSREHDRSLGAAIARATTRRSSVPASREA